MGVVTAITAGAALIGSAATAIGAEKDRQRAKSRKKKANAELEAIKNKRATIINPYSETEDLSSMAKDLSGQMSNPFEN